MSRYFKPTLLKPRSAKEQMPVTTRRDRRQSMIMRRSPSLLVTAIPAILTAAAVYISLVYATKLTARFFGTEPEDPGQMIRSVDGVAQPRPFVEQAPPPSPEAVAAEVRASLTGADAQRPRIVLEPVLELDPPEPDAIRLPALPVEFEPPRSPPTDAATQAVRSVSE